MKVVRAAILVLFVATALGSIGAEAQQSDLPGSKLKSGDAIPELSGIDQFGKRQDFDSLKGPNGLVVLFFRSADW